jgi:hypothetical protein
MLACCEPNFDYLAGRAGCLFMLCSIVLGAVVGSNIILRDIFRFARQGIPFPLMAGIATLFAALAYLVLGPAGLLIAPCLLTADLLGRWKIRRHDTQDSDDTTA